MLKAAQVGLGWWGSQVTKVLGDSEKIEIVRGVDPFDETAKKYTTDYGLPVYSDYQEALDDPNVEAVILTIPTSSMKRRSFVPPQPAKRSSARSRWPSPSTVPGR